MITKKVIYYDEANGFEYVYEPIEDTIRIVETENGYRVLYMAMNEYCNYEDFFDDDELFVVHFHRQCWVTKDEIITEEELKGWYQGEKIEAEKDYWIFPLTAYIHSGVRLYLGEHFNPSGQGYGWFDTSHVGAVLVSKRIAKQRKQALGYAEKHVKCVNLYLEGQTFIIVEEKYTKDKTKIDYDSYCGYLGYDDTLKELERQIREV